MKAVIAVDEREQPDAQFNFLTGLPRKVEVQIGGHWLSVTAHATRCGRRGRQVLIDHYGKLLWVSASRLRPVTPQVPNPGDRSDVAPLG
jgi:hypothetical protein